MWYGFHSASLGEEPLSSLCAGLSHGDPQGTPLTDFTASIIPSGKKAKKEKHFIAASLGAGQIEGLQ